MDGVLNVGPLPRGKYTIEECYTGENTDKWGRGTKGDPALSLTPKDGTDIKGRSDFLLHGDYPDDDPRYGTASEGCIVVPRTVRQWIRAHGGGELTVVR